MTLAPGLVVIGGDSCPRVNMFESRDWILDNLVGSTIMQRTNHSEFVKLGIRNSGVLNTLEVDVEKFKVVPNAKRCLLRVNGFGWCTEPRFCCISLKYLWPEAAQSQMGLTEMKDRERERERERERQA